MDKIMCGRFSLASPWELLKERFVVDIPVNDYRVRYNAAPGQNLWVIPEETPYDAQLFQWGLVPFWEKNIHTDVKEQPRTKQ